MTTCATATRSPRAVSTCGSSPPRPHRGLDVPSRSGPTMRCSPGTPSWGGDDGGGAPDGELAAYLESLERIAALTGNGSVTTILPATARPCRTPGRWWPTTGLIVPSDSSRCGRRSLMVLRWTVIRSMGSSSGSMQTCRASVARGPDVNSGAVDLSGVSGRGAEALDVLEEYGAGLGFQPATTGEVGQRLVDRLARGADELGQLLLGRVMADHDAFVDRPAEAARQVEQGLATRPGTSVKTRSASDSLVRRSLDERCEQGERDLRAALEVLTQLFGREGEHLGLGDGGRGGRAGAGVEEESSPNISPGPRMASRFSRPSTLERPSFTLPLRSRRAGHLVALIGRARRRAPCAWPTSA